MTKLKLTAAAAVIAALSTPSYAGSLPSGFYGGLNIGYDIGNTATSTSVTAGTYFDPSSVTSINASSPTDLNRSGINGGAQLGYNFMSGTFGFGVEADFAYMGRNEAEAVTVEYPCCLGTFYTSAQVMERDWLATFRARLGFDVGGAFLYGTGGLALGDVSYAAVFSDTFFPIPLTAYAVSNTELGWTAGGGLEIPFGSNYSAKVEYLYVDLGSQTVSGLVVAGFTDVLTSTADFKQHIARFGINMHF